MWTRKEIEVALPLLPLPLPLPPGVQGHNPEGGGGGRAQDWPRGDRHRQGPNPLGRQESLLVTTTSCFYLFGILGP